MKKNFFYFLSFSIFFSLKSFSQNDSLIIKNIIISESSIIIDHNFIDQNNFNIYKDNIKIPDSLYIINFSTGLITFNQSLINDTIRLQYELLNPDLKSLKSEVFFQNKFP